MKEKFFGRPDNHQYIFCSGIKQHTLANNKLLHTNKLEQTPLSNKQILEIFLANKKTLANKQTLENKKTRKQTDSSKQKQSSKQTNSIKRTNSSKQTNSSNQTFYELQLSY